MMLAILLAVVVYAALAFFSDVRSLRQHLQTFAWSHFAVALLLAFGNYVVRFVKWEYYLRRLGIGASSPGEAFRPLPTGESFAIFLSGFAMSITPGKAGEVFKSALLYSARGVPVARSAPIVVADRLSDLLSLIVLVAIGSTAFPGYGWIAALAAGLVAMVLLFVFVEPLALGMVDLVGRFRFGARIAPRLREAYGALRTVTTPGALVVTTVVSAIAWALECAALWVVLRGLGTRVDVALAFFAYATATIAGAIAMLPGGLGGTELTMREILTSLGHTGAAVAMAATLIVRLATLWFAVVVGFVALGVFRRRYDRRVGGATETSPPATVAAG
jgi:uncharacterized protein (TIRG00374 family)